MDDLKIRRFLETVNSGLLVSMRRLEAERSYLERLTAHLPLLRENIVGLLGPRRVPSADASGQLEREAHGAGVVRGEAGVADRPEDAGPKLG